MPRPLYIICSASGALDQYTNAVSLFGVIEHLTFREARPQPDGMFVIPPLSMRIVSAWVKGNEDAPQDRFEAQLAAFVEGHEGEVFTTDFPPFSFEATVHRLILPELRFPANFEIPAGLLRFQCRIRREGQREWTWHQDYAIPVEQHPEERAAEQQAAPPARPADGPT